VIRQEKEVCNPARISASRPAGSADSRSRFTRRNSPSGADIRQERKSSIAKISRRSASASAVGSSSWGKGQLRAIPRQARAIKKVSRKMPPEDAASGPRQGKSSRDERLV
jgi:hypothetical protein